MTPIEYATALLLNGKLVAIPTETVYGLGADAKNSTAVQKIYTVKGRPLSNPLIIHIPNVDAMLEWAIEIPPNAWKLAKTFWPGPLTFILKKHPDVPFITTGGLETVALRIPNHPLTLELLQRFKGGIAAPSANRYGRLSPTTADHVREALGIDVDYILDGGPCTIGIESTIVYLVESKPIILRQGSISASVLSETLQEEVLINDRIPTLKTPGSEASHYAPNQPLYLLEKNSLIKKAIQLSEENRPFSVLCFFKKPDLANLLVTKWICAPLNSELYAQQLYNWLHLLDKENSEVILVEMPPLSNEWLAIIDRLQRAAYR